MREGPDVLIVEIQEGIDGAVFGNASLWRVECLASGQDDARARLIDKQLIQIKDEVRPLARRNFIHRPRMSV